MNKKKTCGSCKYFSYIDGDMDARDYPDGGNWGYCYAPVPQYVHDVSNGTVKYDSKAKNCGTYKKNLRHFNLLDDTGGLR